MELDNKGFLQLTDSLSLYHRITNEKYSVDDDTLLNVPLLERLYVDLLPKDGVLNKILEKKTTFLVGRKGTGKSTIFSRAQYEIHKKKKDISVYINAKTLYKACEISKLSTDSLQIDNKFTENELFKLALLKKVIQELGKSIDEELKKEEYNVFEKVTNKFVRDKQLEHAIKTLLKLSSESELVNIGKILVQENNTERIDELTGGVKTALKECSAEGEVNFKHSTKNGNAYTNILARIFNVDKIIDQIKQILDICKRTSMYIFIDDYSELARSERTVFMESIISPMYHLGVDVIHFKIACYPNKVSPIELDSGKYSIESIDLYDIYGKDNNIPDTEKLAADYVRRLLENRCEIYCKSNIEQYFDTKNAELEEYYKTLFNASMNVPRVLGQVLNECYLKNIVYNKPIGLTTIKEASKKYYYNHVLVYFNKQCRINEFEQDNKLDIFVQESLKDSLINIAQKNKYELISHQNSYTNNGDSIYTSHFTISPECEQYLEELEFNGFLHKINTLAAKSRKKGEYKNITNLLYALDFGLCIDEKILYGKPDNMDTKYYQQRAFNYDDVILTSLKNNKKIECTNCGATFPIDDLDIIKRFGMTCSECHKGKCEVKFDIKLMKKVEKTIANTIWSNSEFDILHSIKLLKTSKNNDKITVNDISREIDYSYQFITWRCKDLQQKGYIIIDNESTPNTYDLSEKSNDLLQGIVKED